MESNSSIPFLPSNRFYNKYKKDLDDIFNNIMTSQDFIMRQDVDIFESNISSFLNIKHCISVGSGSSALELSVKSLDIPTQTDVLLPGNTHISTVNAVIHNGLNPILVDSTQNYSISPSILESHITSNTSAIIVVHIGGHTCEISQVAKLAHKHNIHLIEDSAQSFGSQHKGKFAGTYGTFGCFSLHPMKTIGGFGDGGFIVTNNDLHAARLRALRNVGLDSTRNTVLHGVNSRLDNLQAALINFKFSTVKNILKRRARIRDIYLSNLSKKHTTCFYTNDEIPNPFYIFGLKNRDALQQHLAQHNIETFIHWSPLINQIDALPLLSGFTLPQTEEMALQMLSVPSHELHTDDEILRVCNKINEFYE